MVSARRLTRLEPYRARCGLDELGKIPGILILFLLVDMGLGIVIFLGF